jgi:hypothetical protein
LDSTWRPVGQKRACRVGTRTRHSALWLKKGLVEWEFRLDIAPCGSRKGLSSGNFNSTLRPVGKKVACRVRTWTRQGALWVKEGLVEWEFRLDMAPCGSNGACRVGIPTRHGTLQVKKWLVEWELQLDMAPCGSKSGLSSDKLRLDTAPRGSKRACRVGVSTRHGAPWVKKSLSSGSFDSTRHPVGDPR